MPDLAAIYAGEAERYDALVSREDAAGNLVGALVEIRDPLGLDVVEPGAGTGRLTRMLASRAGRVVALDASPHMLRLAARRLRAAGLSNWTLGVADHRALPVRSGAADLVVAGWTICYTVLGQGAGWVASLQAALDEMRRVLRPGGVVVILETLGTGYEAPHPPEELREYYAHLERLGFAHRWARTDYAFANAAEAERLTRFFFGDALADRVAADGLDTVPECTGIWWEET